MEQRKETIPAVIVTRTIRAKRERVYNAWTNPELMNKWFCPQAGRAVVANDLRVGGSWKNEMIVEANTDSVDYWWAKPCRATTRTEANCTVGY